jgi:uncharacterized RDD family membrane protein YckC
MNPTDTDPGYSSRVSTELLIETPENVRLSYRLAGPATRLLSYLVDLALQIGIIVVVIILCTIGGVTVGAGASLGAFLVVWFFLDWAYFGISEAFFRGKTVGKHLFGLRVLQEKGYPATVWGGLIRNFLRAADGISAYGVGFVTMFVSGKFRRLGDLLAETVVVEERRVRVPREPIILEKIKPLSRNELGSFVPSGQTLAVIEEFLGRRHVLTYRRGHAMAHLLARKLAMRLQFSGDPQQVERYPMAFLAAVYATFHQVHEKDGDQDVLDDVDAPRPRRRPRMAGVAS